MQIINYSDPWDHFEIENFLSESEFEQVKIFFGSLPEPGPANDRMNVYWNTNGEELASGHANGPAIRKILMDKFAKLLSLLSVEYTLDTHSIHIEFDKISPGFEWQIHNDLWTKAVSVIIHVSDKGHGTRLYSEPNKESLVRTVNWIPRGGGGFIRGDHTHHSFDTLEDDTIRETIILTLRVNKDWKTGEPL